MNNTIKAHIALLFANLIYGLNYVIAKGIMPDYLAPRAIIFLRVFGAIILFWLFHKIFVKEKVEKKDLFKLALCAVFGIAINQILFFEGLNLTSSINSSIIMTINPVLVLVFSYFLIKEKITLIKITGIIFGCTGAILLILNEGTISLNSDTFSGNLLVLVSTTSFAVYLVLIKPLMMKYQLLTVMKWLFFFGFIYIIPFCSKEIINTDWQNIPSNIWLSVLYVVLATTVIAYLLYNFSLKTVSPTIASTYMYLQPIMASVVVILLGKDMLTLEKVIFAVLIFIGVYLVSIKQIKNK